MRAATTPVVLFKPTVTETALAERQQIIRLSQAGWTATAIVAQLGGTVRTVTRWRGR